MLETLSNATDERRPILIDASQLERILDAAAERGKLAALAAIAADDGSVCTQSDVSSRVLLENSSIVLSSISTTSETVVAQSSILQQSESVQSRDRKRRREYSQEFQAEVVREAQKLISNGIHSWYKKIKESWPSIAKRYRFEGTAVPAYSTVFAWLSRVSQVKTLKDYDGDHEDKATRGEGLQDLAITPEAPSMMTPAG